MPERLEIKHVLKRILKLIGGKWPFPPIGAGFPFSESLAEQLGDERAVRRGVFEANKRRGKLHVEQVVRSLSHGLAAKTELLAAGVDDRVVSFACQQLPKRRHVFDRFRVDDRQP